MKMHRKAWLRATQYVEDVTASSFALRGEGENQFVFVPFVFTADDSRISLVMSPDEARELGERLIAFAANGDDHDQ